MYREILPIELNIQRSNGYIYFIDKLHPLKCGNSNKVYLHRHTASISLGRWIDSSEHVHHIDHNKSNNSPDNLKLMTSSEHTLYHLHDGIAGTIVKLCSYCGEEFIAKTSEYTRHLCGTTCVAKNNIKDSTLTKELLDSLIPYTSWVLLGKMFGYSDNGIKKRAIALGCNIKELKRRSGPKD